MAPRASEKSQLKRGRVSWKAHNVSPFKKSIIANHMSTQHSAGEGQDDSKKPRRSERISSQTQTTPLKVNTHLPSPFTHQESSTTEVYKEATVSPPEGRPSQIRHRTPVSSPPHQGLSSPPLETQPTQLFSQFVYPPKTLSVDVEDEEAEGVWGYLVPLDSIFGETLVLRKRTACPAPFPASGFGKGSDERGERGCGSVNFNAEELDYEKNKRKHGFPAGGYLIGRHPECGKMMVDKSIRGRWV